MPPPLVLLDTASLYFRAFHALPESLRAADDTPVGAVRGFCDTLARVLTERRPGSVVACLDADWRPQFRVELLPSYKAHRVRAGSETVEDAPQALLAQVPIILEVLAGAGLATAQAAGYEADDVIGTLTHAERTAPVEIITGDRDLFQLVRKQPTPASVVYVGRGWAKAETLGPREVAAKYGVPAATAGQAYAEMAILRGDPSDGLAGVPGIGDKTAAKLINRFATVAGLREAARAEHPEVPPRLRSALRDAANYLEAAPRVVRVVTDVPIEYVPTDPAQASSDRVRLAELGQRWNLGSAMERLLAALDG